MTNKERLVDLLARAKRSMWGQVGLTSELARNIYVAEYLLANGVTVQEWHPASEPPKAEENPVLGDFYGIVNPAWYHANTQEWETPSGAILAPKHWMPMPQPPKKEEEL